MTDQDRRLRLRGAKLAHNPGVVAHGKAGDGLTGAMAGQVGGGDGVTRRLERTAKIIEHPAAAKAAMMTVPKLLTRPCTIRMPKFIMDC